MTNSTASETAFHVCARLLYPVGKCAVVRFCHLCSNAQNCTDDINLALQVPWYTHRTAQMIACKLLHCTSFRSLTLSYRTAQMMACKPLHCRFFGSVTKLHRWWHVNPCIAGSLVHSQNCTDDGVVNPCQITSWHERLAHISCKCLINTLLHYMQIHALQVVWCMSSPSAWVLLARPCPRSGFRWRTPTTCCCACASWRASHPRCGTSWGTESLSSAFTPWAVLAQWHVSCYVTYTRNS